MRSLVSGAKRVKESIATSAIATKELASGVLWSSIPEMSIAQVIKSDDPVNAICFIENRLSTIYTGRNAEAEILELLSSASDSLYVSTLEAVGMSRMICGFRDHRTGPRFRAELLKLLASTRLALLPLKVRLALLRAVFASCKQNAASSTYIVNILLSLSGKQLLWFKTEVDTAEDTCSLVLLVYDWLTPSDRKLLLSIWDEEVVSAVGRSEMKVVARAQSLEWRIKVLSDVDDTLYASLHDQSFPRGTVYPGVLSLYRAFDRGPNDNPVIQGSVVFLTARPPILESYTRGKLVGYGISQKAMLPGSLWGLRSHGSMAAKKFENYMKFRSVYPEYNFVFIGDSGQGDIELSHQMLKYTGRPVGALGLALIHDVEDSKGVKKLNQEARERLAKQNVIVFDCYLTAALEACKRGLISSTSLIELREVVVELTFVANAGNRGWRASLRQKELNTAVQQVNDYLSSNSSQPS